MSTKIQEYQFKVENPDVFKKASLAIFGLSEVDQKWILSNLPQHQAEKLSVHLNDLVSLGIQQDSTLIDEILGSEAQDFYEGRDQSDDYSEMLKHVDQLSADQVFTILSNESVNAIAMTLSVKNWPWATKYLSSISTELADDVRGLVNDYVGSMSQAVKVAIVEYLVNESGRDNTGNSRLSKSDGVIR